MIYQKNIPHIKKNNMIVTVIISFIKINMIVGHVSIKCQY